MDLSLRTISAKFSSEMPHDVCIMKPKVEIGRQPNEKLNLCQDLSAGKTKYKTLTEILQKSYSLPPVIRNSVHLTNSLAAKGQNILTVNNQNLLGIKGQNIEAVIGQNTQDINGRNIQAVNGQNTQDINDQNIQAVNIQNTQSVDGQSVQAVNVQNTQAVNSQNTQSVDSQSVQAVNVQNTQAVNGPCLFNAKRRRKQANPRKVIKTHHNPERKTTVPILPKKILDNGHISDCDEGQTTQSSDLSESDLMEEEEEDTTHTSAFRPKKITSRIKSREKRKELRLHGKEYTTPSGKTYPERRVREKDCSRCRYSCSQNITSEQRQEIFNHFWSLDSYVKRLYYYCQSIKEKPARTMTHTRECCREYTFIVGKERVRVCKGFYLATLDVSDKAVRIAMEKRKKGKGMWDKRGLHPPHNKTRPVDREHVCQHIEAFLTGDVSNGSEEKDEVQLGFDLNITKMHQNYVKDCENVPREPVSEDVYRKIFNAEYNLSPTKL